MPDRLTLNGVWDFGSNSPRDFIVNFLCMAKSLSERLGTLHVMRFRASIRMSHAYRAKNGNDTMDQNWIPYLSKRDSVLNLSDYALLDYSLLHSC